VPDRPLDERGAADVQIANVRSNGVGAAAGRQRGRLLAELQLQLARGVEVRAEHQHEAPALFTSASACRGRRVVDAVAADVARPYRLSDTCAAAGAAVASSDIAADAARKRTAWLMIGKPSPKGTMPQEAARARAAAS
jgi:hypothetical protein